MGYSMGGINWDDTSLGRRLGGHVKAVFTIITFIFIACVTFTVTSFKEIPLWALTPAKTKSARSETDHLQDGAINYGTLDEAEYNPTEPNHNPVSLCACKCTFWAFISQLYVSLISSNEFFSISVNKKINSQIYCKCSIAQNIN